MTVSSFLSSGESGHFVGMGVVAAEGGDKFLWCLFCVFSKSGAKMTAAAESEKPREFRAVMPPRKKQALGFQHFKAHIILIGRCSQKLTEKGVEMRHAISRLGCKIRHTACLI